MKNWKQGFIGIVAIMVLAIVFIACEDKHEHDFQWVETKAATYEDEGLETEKCTCGATNGTRPIAKLVDLLSGLSAAERWNSWHDQPSTTITHSVANDGVCAITVGGTALTGMPLWDYLWKATAVYAYTASAGKTYSYTFEAWTSDANRKLNVQLYADNNNQIYDDTGYADNLPVFTITSERKTYTLNGSILIPKSGTQQLSFQCANQIGTFYVKIISITPADNDPSGDSPPSDDFDGVTWQDLTANGIANTEDTTELTLTFSPFLHGLAIGNVTVIGATEETLTPVPHLEVYTLTISNITVAQGESVTVMLTNPSWGMITPSSKTVAINKAP